MADKATKTATDTTSDAQGRFTVQLSAALRPLIADLGKEATRSVKESMGIDIDLSMAQVVTGIITAQHEVLTAKRAAAEASADGDKAPEGGKDA